MDPEKYVVENQRRAFHINIDSIPHRANDSWSTCYEQCGPSNKADASFNVWLIRKKFHAVKTKEEGKKSKASQNISSDHQRPSYHQLQGVFRIYRIILVTGANPVKSICDTFPPEASALGAHLQGVISIHHPAVCPGGHDQKPSSEKCKEAGDILEMIPHGGEQAFRKGHMGRCSSGPARGAGMPLASVLIPGDEEAQVLLFLTPAYRHLKLQLELHKQAETHRGVWRSLSEAAGLQSEAGVVKGLGTFWWGRGEALVNFSFRTVG